MNSDEDYVGVSLRIWSLTHSPADISALLGRAAKYSAVMGAPRGRSHGAELHVWKTHYWCADFMDGTTVEDRIGAVAHFLHEHGSLVEATVGPDGRSEVYLFLAPASTLGLTLNPSTLKPLVDHGVRLAIEFLLMKDPHPDMVEAAAAHGALLSPGEWPSLSPDRILSPSLTPRDDSHDEGPQESAPVRPGNGHPRHGRRWPRA